MGMNFSYYIGPYLKVEKKNRSGKDYDISVIQDDLLYEGRGECADDDVLILVSCRHIDKVVFQKFYQAEDNPDHLPLSVKDIASDKAYFNEHVVDILKYLEEMDVDYEICFGVVPGWS